jgi:MFS family permease
MKPQLAQLFANAGLMTGVTFFPLYVKEHGVTTLEVSYLAIGYSIALVISSISFGRFSDLYGRRTFIKLGLLLSGLSIPTYLLLTGFWQYLFLRTITGFCMGIYPAALVAYVTDTNKKLGKFSSFGSLGWALGGLFGGILAEYVSIESVFIAASGIFFVAFLIALTLEPTEVKPVIVPILPVKLMVKNFRVLFAFLLRHGTASAIWIFWPLFLIEELQLNNFQLGIVQATNMGTQFFVMFLITDLIDNSKLVTYGLYGSAVTFVLFTLCDSFLLITLTQVLLGVSWAALYVGSLKSLTESNKEKATAASLLNSTSSLSFIFGPIIAFFIYSYFESYEYIMLFAAFFSLVSMVYWIYSEPAKE